MSFKAFVPRKAWSIYSVIIQECLVLRWLATDQNRECTLAAWSLDLSLLKSKQQSLSQALVFYFYTDHWLFSLDFRVCRGVKYHEPEYWKFGEEGNKYFRHATGQIYAVSKDLATYISVNRWVLHNDLSQTPLTCWQCLIFFRQLLHKYANEDVSLGSWFIGLDVEHIDDRSLCCGTPLGKRSMIPIDS